MTPGQLLERLGFTSAQLSTPVKDLSGGQKRRLQLLLILLDEPNVLILDEPTNDLDTDMLAAMEDLLDSWPGTLLVVSHDRYLLERVTDQQYAVLDGAPAAPARRRRPVPRAAQAPTEPGGRSRERAARRALRRSARRGRSATAPSRRAGRAAHRRTARTAPRRRSSAIDRKLDKLQAQIEQQHEKVAVHDQSDFAGLAALGARSQASRRGRRPRGPLARSSPSSSEWLQLAAAGPTLVVALGARRSVRSVGAPASCSRPHATSEWGVMPAPRHQQAIAAMTFAKGTTAPGLATKIPAALAAGPSPRRGAAAPLGARRRRRGDRRRREDRRRRRERPVLGDLQGGRRRRGHHGRARRLRRLHAAEPGARPRASSTSTSSSTSSTSPQLQRGRRRGPRADRLDGDLPARPVLDQVRPRRGHPRRATRSPCPNDASNQARALLVLQSAGLIELKDGGTHLLDRRRHRRRRSRRSRSPRSTPR